MHHFLDVELLDPSRLVPLLDFPSKYMEIRVDVQGPRRLLFPDPVFFTP